MKTDDKVKAILLFIYIAAIGGCLAAMSGCNTTKQANKAMDKAFRKDSAAVAARCANAFPVVITDTKTDTVNSFEFIEVEVPVECDSVLVYSNDTVRIKGAIKYVKQPQKVLIKTITHTITIKSTAESAAANARVDEAQRLVKIKDRVMWSLFGVIAVMALIILFTRKKK